MPIKATSSDTSEKKSARTRKKDAPAKPDSPSKKAAAAKTPAPVDEPVIAEPAEVLDLLDPSANKVKKKKSASEKKKFLLPSITSKRDAEAGGEPSADEAGSSSGEPAASPGAAEAAAEITVESTAPSTAPAELDSPLPEEVPEGTRKVIHVKPPIIIKELAALMGIKGFQLIHDLMEVNIFASINQTIEPDVAAKICEKHGFVFEKEKRDKEKGIRKPEPVAAPPPKPVEPAPGALQGRAPIVTLMGHVDHGKTSLLDSIRKSRVAAGEAGGITQHIGAYRIEHNGQPITFLDTPGHAAFTAMRARGANVTDVVVLVVAADDGLMPQTIEAINHAKAAGATIIVAINKIDLPGANPDRVKTQLQEHGLVPEDWGGETIVCPVSATKGTGVEDLISMILLQSEVLELKGSPNSPDARAIVIEAEIEPGRGPTATLIVKSGTLKNGDPFICGDYSGKIKQLLDDRGKPVKAAGPSIPVKLIGFSGLPKAGDELVVMESERAAKAISEERLDAVRMNKLTTPARATLESLFAANDTKKLLRLVVKSDVQGSLEAIVASLKEIPSTKISLEIIHSAVGPISESDVLLATASDAVILGFGVKVENSAAQVAKREGVQIKLFSIIYELIDQVKEAMAGMLDPETRETVIGHAEVKQIFELRKGKVAGCVVLDGRISRAARARVVRKKNPMYDGPIGTLRRFQDDVKEVRAGLECGIKLGDFEEYEPGDTIECYQLEKVPQQL